MKTMLTVAGSDSSGGAGIQADIKTAAAHGVYAESVITALTAQNTTGVMAIEEVGPAFLGAQLDAVFKDIYPDAVKVGMVPSAELIDVVADKLAEYGARNVVVDPVMVATSGSALIKGGAVYKLAERLFPLALLVTPNLPEGEALCGRKISCAVDMEKAAAEIGDRYGCSVLLKGGHSAENADDLLYTGGKYLWLRGKRIDNPNTHGTGCTLSSAIACNLACGLSLEDAAAKAKEYVAGALAAGLNLGRGSGPLNHAYKLTEK